MTQRRKIAHFADEREQWTTMALMRMFDHGPPVWDPAYPQEERVRLRCNACNAVLGRVRYHDGMAYGADVPVYLADVQTVVINPDARPVEVASMTVVLSPLTIDLHGIFRMSADPNKLALLDESARQALFELLRRLSERYPDGRIPVTADAAEKIQVVCSAVAHRPRPMTAGELLTTARSATGDKPTVLRL